MIEYYNMIQSDNGSINEGHALRQWSKRYMASIDSLKNPRVAMSMRTYLDKAGLINVKTLMFPIPLSPWPSGMCIFGVLCDRNIAIIFHVNNVLIHCR